MSYRITMDGNPFCSSNVEHSAVLDPSVSLEVNKAGKLTFTILPDHPMYDQIALRQSMFDVYQNDELIFEGIATQEDTDFYNRKVISCEGELTFLNDSIQRQAKYTNQSVQSLLGAYLAVHNSQVDADRQFSLGSVTVSEGNGILRYTNFQNTMKEIGEDLIDNYGGYLRVRHQDGYRYLDYLADPPRTSSQVIRLGKNLIDYSSNLSSLNIITCLIPRGAKIEGEEDVEGLEKRLDIKSVNSGKDYLVGTAASWYGNVWGTQTWDGVTTAAALKTKGEEYLEDAQWSNLVISASAIDLGLMEEDVEQFRILDMIRVVSEPHGIDRNFLLSKLDIKLDHPADTQITLGKETKLSLSARSAKNSTEIQSVETRILPSASENAKQILDSSTDGNIYFKFDDQTGKLYEIDIMDTNDPETAQRIWRWNLGGWGYSNDGGQTYITAATMDGAILASMITTGILKSDDGTTFYLDLDNGVLKGNFSELKISGSAGATQTYANNAASGAVSNYDTNLNQSAVFNKLTNNGQTQGIFLQNGKIYINGEYLKAATVAAGAIVSGAITLDKLAQETTNKIDGANNSEQLVYISKAAGTTSVTAPTSWVTNSTGNQNTWTIKRPAYNSSYPVCFIATQRKDVGGAVTCTTPLIDDTTTIIDGGNIITGTVTANQLAADSVTADKIDVTDLYAIGATIAGWKISSSAIYKDVADPNDSNTVYRVYLQPPLASNPSGTWVLSCQKSTNGGQSFGGTFILYSDGSAKFGDLNIASNGSISTPNISGAWITLGSKANNFVHNISGVNDHYYDYRSNFMRHSMVSATSITFGETDSDGNTTVRTQLDKYQLQLSAEGSSFVGNLKIKPPTNASSNITIQPVVVSTW